MKKKNILNLIKYYSENNDNGFRTTAYEIADEFNKAGDCQLAEYIITLLADANYVVPQENFDSGWITLESVENFKPLFLPKSIKADINGVINAIKKNIGINKFLFQGSPGTGKTDTARYVGLITNSDVFFVDFATIIDSKLGQTPKNIRSLFNEINSLPQNHKSIVIFDEIDTIAMDRTNPNDLREMGRVTSVLIKELDNLKSDVTIIATTNLFSHFDSALIRRFDFTVNFDRYSNEDLMLVAEQMLESFLKRDNQSKRNVVLFRKIMKTWHHLPLPGELENLIKSAFAFSDPGDDYGYLRFLYYHSDRSCKEDFVEMKKMGFTVREIEILCGMSKSSVARILKGTKV